MVRQHYEQTNEFESTIFVFSVVANFFELFEAKTMKNDFAMELMHLCYFYYLQQFLFFNLSASVNFLINKCLHNVNGNIVEAVDSNWMVNLLLLLFNGIQKNVFTSCVNKRVGTFNI